MSMCLSRFAVIWSLEIANNRQTNHDHSLWYKSNFTVSNNMSSELLDR